MVKGKKGQYLSLLIVFVTGFLLSVTASFFTYQNEQDKIQALFNDAASYRFKLIEDGAQSNLWALESFSSFYASSRLVERNEFKVFAEGIFQRQPYILEFRWVPRVSDSQRQEFEIAARADGLQDFTIKQISKDGKFINSPKKQEYFPVYYINSSPGDNYDLIQEFGLDASSLSERWQVMQIARDMGEPAIASETKEYKELNIPTVSRIFLPIFRNGLSHETLEERRENLTGFVVLIFRLDELVENSLKGIPAAGVDIVVNDPEYEPGRVLYTHFSRLRKSTVSRSLYIEKVKSLPFAWVRPLKIADRYWEIICVPSPEFLAAHRSILPWVTLAVGLFLTLISVLYLRAIINKEKSIKLLVEKRTEELYKAEEKYRILYESSADAIMTLVPPEWNFISGNPKTINLFGARDENDFISRKPWELSSDYQPDGQPSSVKAKKMIDIAMEKGSNYFEWKHKKIDGEEFFATVLLSKVESRGSAFLQATVRDISLQKKLEKELQRLNREQTIILDSVPAWIFYKDKENRFIRVNKAYSDIMGLTKKELEGRSLFEIYPREQAESYWKDDKEVIASGKAKLNIIESVNTKNGLLWVLTDKVPYYDDDGNIIGIIGFSFNITERKIQEEKIKQANKDWLETFNSISDFVFILDKESTITKVNNSMLNALQLNEEDVLGKKCYEIMHKTNCPWPACPHQQTITDKSAHTEEVLDPGLGVPLLVSTSPILNDLGEIIGSVHIAKDISVLKRQEGEIKRAKEELEVEAWGLNKANEGIKVLYKELEQKNEELKKADQLKSDFVSIVSHELRTPLAIMKEGVSLVLDNLTGAISKKTAITLEMVYNNIIRLSKLINDLLDISKIEAGRLQLKKSFVDINYLVRDTAAKFLPEAKKKNQEVLILAEDDRFNIYIDSDKIIQILNNLLSNAIKFTPEKGRIIVQVSVNKDEVEITVSDNGIGIPPADLPNVFGKFQQFDRAEGAGAKGTGLGLAICKELVELHEGLIRVESNPGVGTKFSFTLPIKDSEAVFKEHITEGVKDVSARNSSLALISMRISNFNKLQKDLGSYRTHDFLKEIEDIISGSLRRKADTVVRDVIGELIIILFDTNKQGAQAARLRIEEVLRGFLTSSTDEVIKNTTFNVGIACYPEEAKNALELLDKARGVVHAL